MDCEGTGYVASHEAATAAGFKSGKKTALLFLLLFGCCGNDDGPCIDPTNY